MIGRIDDCPASATRPALESSPALDGLVGRRDTACVIRSGALRQQVSGTLNAAYGEGLVSHNTLLHRLDRLFEGRVLDLDDLIGDLSLRAPEGTRSRTVARLLEACGQIGRLGDDPQPPPAAVLALDWSGEVDTLLIGRHQACDIVLDDPTVSRRHARLRFGDGCWVLRDLQSTNGTTVNQAPVVRCQLRPSDHLAVGDFELVVD